MLFISIWKMHKKKITFSNTAHEELSCTTIGTKSRRPVFLVTFEMFSGADALELVLQEGEGRGDQNALLFFVQFSAVLSHVFFQLASFIF